MEWKGEDPFKDAPRSGGVKTIITQKKEIYRVVDATSAWGARVWTKQEAEWVEHTSVPCGLRAYGCRHTCWCTCHSKYTIVRKLFPILRQLILRIR